MRAFERRASARTLLVKSALLFPASILFLLFIATSAWAQWDTQSPVPTFLQVNGVGVTGAQHVFLATNDDNFDNGGALWESTDGGTTWTQRDVPFDQYSGLNGLFFLDADHGWAYGNYNYRTTDGGATWTELPFLGSAYFLEFATPAFGLISGNFGQYVSTDGGLNWNPSPEGMFGFDFQDDLVGLGVSASGVYRTTDGGTSFDLVRAGNAGAVAFLSPTTALAIVDGAFARSTDGGLSWTSGAAAAGRNTLTAVSSEVVLAWGRSGDWPDFDDRLLRSADGGQTWNDLGEIMPAGVSGIAQADPLNLAAADFAGAVHHSADGGQTWDQVFTSPGPLPGGLGNPIPVFADAQTGYYAYGPGFVIKSTDGGATWAQVSSGTDRNLHDVARFADGRLVAVGAGGAVLLSDGASPWILQAPFTSQDLVAVQIIGPDEVVTVDGSGLVHFSSDGGVNWTVAASGPAGMTPADLHFTSALEGWVIGNGPGDGSLFRTTDGGTSWSAVPGPGGNCMAVDFAGQTGWALNISGSYFMTLDGGTIWTEGSLPGSFIQVADLEFHDQSTGYAVGWGGYAARSDDGGATWQQLPVPDDQAWFTDLQVMGPNELWVSTHNGQAYYSATGGQNWAVLDIGSAGYDWFSAITATPAGDAWTVGDQGYIEHFTGPPPPPLNWAPDTSFEFTAMGLTVGFTDTSSDQDGFITSWLWDFGDGEVSAEQNPTHTYAAANTYVVRLTVADDAGETGTAARIITAQPGPGGTFGDFTEVTPLDPLFVTPQDEDFWVITTAPADYDGDGDLDVAVLGYYVVYNQSVVDRLVLLRNDGQVGPEEWDFSYLDISLGGLSAGASDLAWGDADSDGDLDLALGSDGQTVIYRNDGGALVLTDTVLPGYWEDNDQAEFDLRSLSWADYDNDGDQDLLIPSVFDQDAWEYRTHLMRNDGPNGTGGWLFTSVAAGLAGTSHGQSAWADFDGDQDLDLLLVNVAPLYGDSFIRRYRNDGGGVFTGQDILGGVVIVHGEAQWGDYDADGDLDVLVAGNLAEGGSYDLALRIYRNDDETYVPEEVLADVPGDGWFDLTAATWADYDTDGDMDILLAGNYNSGSNIEGRARIYGNDGGVFFDSGNELPAPRATGSRGGTFSWLDLDGDGDLDYFIAGQYFVPGGNGLVEAQMHVYLNGSQGQNGPPSLPAGLNALVQEGTGNVVLSWNGATDDHTLGTAMTYDLDLFLGGVPVELPCHQPEPGNVGAVSQWHLAGLADGDYRWALRAVDSAFNAGPVATGQFNIGMASGVDQDPNLPMAYALDRNYPNPFNPSTTLSFSLPEKTHVTLTVYDLHGALVSRLVDEPREAGHHEFRWEPRGLASGTYFVRMTTPAFTRTQRVMLLK